MMLAVISARGTQRRISCPAGRRRWHYPGARRHRQCHRRRGGRSRRYPSGDAGHARARVACHPPASL